MDPLELEHHVDATLRRYAAPHAPATLLPRVMQAVRRVPAAAEGWASWPLPLQAATIAAGVLLVVGLLRIWPTAIEATWAVVAPTVEAVAPGIADAAREVDSVASAARVIWRVVIQPVAVVAMVLVIAMLAAFAVFGAALQRVALGGVSR
jgi:hypothetical protein